MARDEPGRGGPFMKDHGRRNRAEDAREHLMHAEHGPEGNGEGHARGAKAFPSGNGEAPPACGK